ncbi:hypothetical protein ACFQ9V_17600 [Leifsonia sp. NPDC056665]|uniref:hypothetical protein n=1 Tax=Leifsonia sp. NPDC056665 TaxID=3345901 RepID=UPI003677B78A
MSELERGTISSPTDAEVLSLSNGEHVAQCPTCPWEGGDQRNHFSAALEAAHHNLIVHQPRTVPPESRIAREDPVEQAPASAHRPSGDNHVRERHTVNHARRFEAMSGGQNHPLLSKLW